jgi:hypothetical protein
LLAALQTLAHSVMAHTLLTLGWFITGAVVRD